jgi:hypothetical protein
MLDVLRTLMRKIAFAQAKRKYEAQRRVTDAMVAKLDAVVTDAVVAKLDAIVTDAMVAELKTIVAGLRRTGQHTERDRNEIRRTA